MVKNNQCRICGLKRETTLNLFLTKLKPDLTLSTIYHNVTNLKIEEDDAISAFVCCHCSARLSDAYNLKLQAEETYRRLNSLNVEVDYLESDSDDDASSITELDDNSNLSAKTDRIPTTEGSSSFVDVEELDMCGLFNENDQSEDAVQFLNNKIFGKEGNKVVNPPRPKARKKRPRQERGTHKCEVCDRFFVNQSNLVDHLRLHANVKLFRCIYCDKSFVQVGNYRTHLRTHTNERPYRCQLCPKSYSQSSSLKIHIRSHTNERNYRCSDCGKAFTNSTDLGKHKRLHNPNMQFKCNVCDSKFAQKVNMLKHKQSKHAGQTQS